MREKIELSPLPEFPSDPGPLIQGPIAFLHSGDKENKKLLAMGAVEELKIEEPGRGFAELERFLDGREDWAFGCLSYELKDELEDLGPPIGRSIAPAIHFFRPKVLFHLENERTIAEHLPEAISGREVQELHRKLRSEDSSASPQRAIHLRPRKERSDHLRAVKALQEHIQEGDIYEVNFCQEFFEEGIPIDPYRTFKTLQGIARAPMAAYFRSRDLHLLCASPERFLRTEGAKVLAQPMKGTAPRKDRPEADERVAEALRMDPKERAENIMIADLVRNDLSKTAAKGSVKVEELCGVYPFPTVHQMISSISSEIAPGKSGLDVIEHAFPMGSMTGAPKVRAMELIEEWEGMPRGLYSGSVGYKDPEGNWDLNVVIRSLLYDARKPYLSAMVGGAITARSDPQKEYEECLLKVEALKRAVA